MAAHVPVMVEPVLRLLAPRPGARIVDATLGQGGHAEAILRHIGSAGELLGIDQDAEQLAQARQRLAPFGSRVRLAHARFSELPSALDAAGLPEVDGVLLDLGLSSAQLDDAARGFAFRSGRDAPLDMRFDRARGLTAAELLERLGESELCRVLRAGDVPSPTRVARALLARLPIRTVGELLDALDHVKLPRRRHHPATLVFQALRMAVNGEQAELDQVLQAALDRLAPGGRIAVLSYHSGEDRTVKTFLAGEARGCICPPDLPRCGCGRTPRIKLLARGERASEDEVLRNPRARSARLRGGEKL